MPKKLVEDTKKLSAEEIEALKKKAAAKSTDKSIIKK